MKNLKHEIVFQSTRSGGKGGQHVNKVETAIIAAWPVAASQLLTEEEKQLVLEKLANRITAEGNLQVKAQTHRTQLENKQEAIEKINSLVAKALEKKKKRLPTRKSRASIEKRLESKKRNSEIKAGRRTKFG